MKKIAILVFTMIGKKTTKAPAAKGHKGGKKGKKSSGGTTTPAPK